MTTLISLPYLLKGNWGSHKTSTYNKTALVSFSSLGAIEIFHRTASHSSKELLFLSIFNFPFRLWLYEVDFVYHETINSVPGILLIVLLYVCVWCMCVHVCKRRKAICSHSPVLAQRMGWDQQGQSVNRGGEGETRFQALGRNWVEMVPLKRRFRNLIF